MNELIDAKPKRKVLSLKLEEKKEFAPNKFKPQYLEKKICVYMVWSPDGHMPKRVYGADEKDAAKGHAKALAMETGNRFYVMRSWRGYDPE